MKATDADTGVNGQVRYSIIPGNGGPTDGYGILTIPLPHKGYVTVANELDYERSRVLVVNIQASVSAGENLFIIYSVNNRASGSCSTYQT